MQLSPDNPVVNIPAPDFTAKGTPVSPKLKDPAQVRRLWVSDWQADVDNRLSRAYVQGMLEGKPPLNPQRMKQAGLEGCCNIDWRYGQLAIRKKMEPYVLMLNSLPVFLNIRTKFGSPQDRVKWGKIMSEKHARMLRSWESFPSRHLYNVLYLSSHGASFCYFNDDTDWRWNVSTLGDMVVPRLTLADEAEFPRLSMTRDWEPSALWEQIKDAVAAKQTWSRPETQDGWHVPTVKAAIQKATYKEFFKTQDWELNEIIWKNKETTYSQSSKIIPTILQWNKEDNGKVTQYIVNKTQIKTDSKEKEEFLYKRPNHFNNMRQGVVCFTRDIGTNGYFHSIRGTGSDIFPIVQKLNEMECAMYDAIKIEMSIPIQGPEEILNDEMAFVQAGPFTIYLDGVTFPERHSSNYSNSAFPGLQMLKQNLADQAGQSKMPEQPGSKIDLQELLTNMSGIDVMESTMFSNPWQRLLRESLRRIVNIKNENESGGREALEFKRQCLEAGVPEQAFDAIDIEDCQAMRPIGNGSPQARLFTMQSMEKLVPFFDEEGRTNWVRDSVAGLPGMDWQNVDRYAPEQADLRPSQQVRNALFENDILMRGGKCPVLANDDHIVHLENQSPAMEEIVQQVEQGQMTMEDAVGPLYPLYLHCNDHITLAMDNPIMKAELNKFRQAMHNVGEIITNGQRKLEARQKKAEENAAKGLDADGNPLPGAEGQEKPPALWPDPMGSGQMLSAEEYGMVARTQIHLQDAARNTREADALHSMKVAQIRQQAIQKARAAKQGEQITDLKAAASIAAKTKPAKPKAE